MAEVEWTLEQATEVVLEQTLSLLDGCDDEDSVRPGLVFEAIRQAWAPQVECEPLECTAGRRVCGSGSTERVEPWPKES